MQIPVMVPTGGHQLPPLPYGYSALEPIISAESLRIHHDILHQNYVNNLNKAELELQKARTAGDFPQISYWENQLAFNGSGHILHSVFWTIMTPLGRGGQPGPLTTSLINEYFGNFAAFKKQFSEAAAAAEGSGWGILVWNPAWRRAEILTALVHQNGTQWGSIPVLVVDVWEHAYYLNYQNRRPQWIENWWRLVDWNEVERRFALAMSGQFPLTKTGGTAGAFAGGFYRNGVRKSTRRVMMKKNGGRTASWIRKRSKKESAT